MNRQTDEGMNGQTLVNVESLSRLRMKILFQRQGSQINNSKVMLVSIVVECLLPNASIIGHSDSSILHPALASSFMHSESIIWHRGFCWMPNTECIILKAEFWMPYAQEWTDG